MALAKGAESSRTSLAEKQHQLSGHSSQKLKHEDCAMTACGKNLLGRKEIARLKHHSQTLLAEAVTDPKAQNSQAEMEIN